MSWRQCTCDALGTSARTGKRANHTMFDKTGKELKGVVLLETANVIRWLAAHER